MRNDRFLKLFVAPALAVAGLTGCTTGFKADVARFQQLPPAQGQSFAVAPDDVRLAGSLEFAHYATLVAQRLTEKGYVRAADPASAQLVVRLSYDIDRGQEQTRSVGWARDPFYDPFYYGRFWGAPRHWGGWGGWRSRYAFGYSDPFLWGDYPDVERYTVFTSELKLRIDRAGSPERLFEGTARARSLSNKMTYLVPNLIDAMFTGFPGNSGEEIRVTVAPEPKPKR
jgi:hypothetical protein